MAMDVRKPLFAALQAALDEVQAEPQKKQKGHGVGAGRALLIGAGLYTAGRVVVGGRGRGMLESLQERLPDLRDGDRGEEPDEGDEEFDDDAAPEGEADEDFDEEAEGEADEDFDDEAEPEDDEAEEEPEGEAEEEPETEADAEPQDDEAAPDEPEAEAEESEPEDESSEDTDKKKAPARKSTRGRSTARSRR
jgi:hypothetical protein